LELETLEKMTNKYSLPRRYFKLISYLLLIIYDLTSALYGEVNTFVGTPGSAGSTNGIGTFAKFTDPYDCAISYDESFALIADWHNQAIRKIILSTGVVTSFIGNFSTAGSANGVGTNARLSNPLSVSIYFDNSYALVADTSNNLIRKIITATAFVTTFAGSSPGATNGIGTMAQFDNPYGVCISPNGAFAIVIEIVGYRIRYMDLATTSVTLLAGGAISGTNGFGTNAGFARPQTASISPDSSYALIADINSYLIRKIIITSAEVTTLAGGSVSGTTNGFGTNALFQSLRGLSISPDGTYVLVTDLNSLRIISIATAEVNIFAGSSASGTTNGIGTSAEFNGVNDVCISSSGSFALVVDIGNQMVRRLDILGQPTRLPSGIPSASPSLATVSYNFGVLFGHPDILSASQCLLTSSIRDVRRGEWFIVSPHPTDFFQRQNVSYLSHCELFSSFLIF
jgi:hypothetical protein